MPKLQLPEKLHNEHYSILTTDARIIVLLGGRGSAKSESVGSTLVVKAQTEGADILCGREYQNSIEESVHKLLVQMIEDRLEVAQYFNITDKKIDCKTGGGFRFRGFSRNPEAVKSAQGFRYSWIEEAQTISQETIDDLLPTIRSSGSKLFFTANPQSSADPFSKRFILPYQRDLITKGFHEDEMHLIIMMNWQDNPWFPKELQHQRLWDLNHLPRSKYDWIWGGAFNDSVEDALVYAEWFDVCIDAHKRLGFEPSGALFAAHDPSDLGGDSKGYALRHGSVVLDVREKASGNINEGCDWATGLANKHGVDWFTWDCDGLGVGLGQQVGTAFRNKPVIVTMFKGSEGVDNPEAIFEGDDLLGMPIQQQKTNKDALANKRAQYYYQLRKRIYTTYQAVEHGKYADPDKMLSFDTSSIDEGMLQRLRSELCRIPIKPNKNGRFELYTKEVMKTKFQIDSPNLSDSLMMTMRVPYVPTSINPRAGRPKPRKAIGRR